MSVPENKNKIIFILNAVRTFSPLLPVFKIGAANKQRTYSLINIAIILHVKRVLASNIACRSAMNGLRWIFTVNVFWKKTRFQTIVTVLNGQSLRTRMIKTVVVLFGTSTFTISMTGLYGRTSWDCNGCCREFSEQKRSVKKTNTFSNTVFKLESPCMR